MSILNNLQTMEQYCEDIWLTRPDKARIDGGVYQAIHVCIRKNSELAAVDFLQLSPDGTYYSRNKAIGSRDSEAFRQYVAKLVYTGKAGKQEIYEEVCQCYKETGSIAEVVKVLNIPKDRVRRILITQGELTNKLIEDIAWLHDGGKGKSITEIAGILNISVQTVQKNMAYGA